LKWGHLSLTFGRFFLPFHKGAIKRPFYAVLRYIFHACLLIIPIWYSGHIFLWEESRLQWYWTPIPDVWADWIFFNPPVYMAAYTQQFFRKGLCHYQHYRSSFYLRILSDPRDVGIHIFF
jgi:hypothetical protein